MEFLKYLYFSFNPFHKPRFKIGDKVQEKPKIVFEEEVVDYKKIRTIANISTCGKHYKLYDFMECESKSSVAYTDATHRLVEEEK